MRINVWEYVENKNTKAPSPLGSTRPTNTAGEFPSLEITDIDPIYELMNEPGDIRHYEDYVNRHPVELGREPGFYHLMPVLSMSTTEDEPQVTTNHTTKPIQDEPTSVDNPKEPTLSIVGMDTSIVPFCVYTKHDQCLEPHIKLRKETNIPSTPPGNCYFHSVIRILNLDQNPREIRDKLLQNSALRTCGNPEEATKILSSDTEYVDIDCIYVFAKEYQTNVCIHYHKDNGEVTYCYCSGGTEKHAIHIHLTGQHFTPYVREEEPDSSLCPDQNQEDNVERSIEDNNSTWDMQQTTFEQSNVLARYLTAEARPPRERQRINEDELLSMTRKTGEIIVNDSKIRK